MLDEFEGDEYYKQDVTAQLEGGGTVDTIVYLWQDSLRPLLYGDWDPDAFRCARWCSEHHRKNKDISSLLHGGCLLGGTRAGWWRQDQALQVVVETRPSLAAALRTVKVGSHLMQPPSPCPHRLPAWQGAGAGAVRGHVPPVCAGHCGAPRLEGRLPLTLLL